MKKTSTAMTLLFVVALSLTTASCSIIGVITDILGVIVEAPAEHDSEKKRERTSLKEKQ